MTVWLSSPSQVLGSPKSPCLASHVFDVDVTPFQEPFLRQVSTWHALDASSGQFCSQQGDTATLHVDVSMSP